MLKKQTNLIVPNFDSAVVSPRNEVRFVPSDVVVDAVDASLVSIQRERSLSAAQLPHLHRDQKKANTRKH